MPIIPWAGLVEPSDGGRPSIGEQAKRFFGSCSWDWVGMGAWCMETLGVVDSVFAKLDTDH